ncbi:hypothetical protein KJY77_04335 [Canibacter sp. lx-72]|uniref:hypothetical protein n=1 Tax=Canibacter zhuwentaonis TaxID=2837491 RepID=UPI001BDC8E04|nr:hypothetical protein [Canibacter zhuwentaonis]MBT1018368.1 hypothetical protein [Canibacter zhuwentaonis]
MGFLGGGLLVLLAVVLWGAVLIPGLARGREASVAAREAEKLRRSMERLETVTVAIAEDERVQSAKEALHREKQLQQRKRAAQAQLRAEQLRADAERKVAEISVKQAARLRSAKIRAAKMQGLLVRRVRLVVAALGAAGLVAVLLGVGVAIAGSGFLVVGIGAGVAVVAFGVLLAIAPGRAVQQVEQQQATTKVAVEQQLLHETVPVAVVDDSAVKYAAAQKAAAERIAKARAEQLARAKKPVPKVNQTDSILLKERSERDFTPARSASAQGGELRDLQGHELRSRLSRIGVVADGETKKVDLDAALRRRRNAA